MKADRAIFTVFGTPVPEGSTRAFVRGGRAAITHVNSQALAAWRREVREASLDAAKISNWETGYEGPVEVEVIFRLPKPQRPKNPVFPIVRPDLDKLQRAIGDALSPSKQEGLLKDDSQIVYWQARKTYVEPGGLPGAIISITRV